MIPSNNPAVGLETRRWLFNTARTEMIHDNGTDLIVRSFNQCQRIHPGGMVFDLSVCLGASRSAAIIAGSIAEIFYTVCSLTDDIQDQETDGYLENVDPALILNMQSQLLCLVAIRANDLLSEIGLNATFDIITDIYSTGSKMLTGQQFELVRSPWNEEIYDKVAQLSAGTQFSLYMKLVSAVAHKNNPADFEKLGHTYGTLLQYVTDLESSDPRLDIVRPTVLLFILKKLASELSLISISYLDEKARLPFEDLIERSKSLIANHAHFSELRQ